MQVLDAETATKAANLIRERTLLSIQTAQADIKNLTSRLGEYQTYYDSLKAKMDKNIEDEKKSLEAIKAGTMTAETWHGFPEWGWYGAEYAVKLALGQEVPAVFDTRPRTEYAGNISSFYPDVKLDPIDWKGIKDTYLNSK